MGLFNNRKKLTKAAFEATNSQMSSNINPTPTNSTNYLLDSKTGCKCTNHTNEKSTTTCTCNITSTNKNGRVEECCNDEVSLLKTKTFNFFLLNN